MDQQLYLKYLKEYTLEALEEAEDNVARAADYIDKKPKPKFFMKDNQEKKAALSRLKKVFTSSRERSLYVVLKSLGFDDLAKEKL
ncbi:MAG: hypothetical protein MUO54_15840 [Anaerolineales bacterium]|nr:hypothetical protein [Anaerolineales bacterium]